MNLERLTKNGLETIEGKIYRGFGVYKENNQYYCVLLNGDNKGLALCSCSKLKLIKEFVNKILDIATAEEIETTCINSNLSKELVKLRNEYWIL